MRTKLICIGLSFYCLLIACSANKPKPDPPDLRKADKVEVRLIVDGKVHEYTNGTKEVIDMFAKVFTGQKSKADCDSMGSIKFYEKDSVLFHGGFSIEKDNCQYIVRGNEAWQLTYNAGMYLRAIFSDSKNYNEEHSQHR